MNKPTKEIITKDFIEKELRFYNKADIRSTLVLMGALSLFFVPLTIGVLYAIIKVFENLALKVLLCVLAGGIFLIPIIYNFFLLQSYLEERELLRGGYFNVKAIKLNGKSEKIVNRRDAKFLHFEDFKEFQTEYTVYDLASVGDEFYIVHYITKRNIKLLYPAKMYEYKE